jgi:hypothetical protein
MNYGTLKQRWAAWTKQTLDAALLAETIEAVAGMVATDVRWLDNQSFEVIAADQGLNVRGTVYKYARPANDLRLRSVNGNGFELNGLAPNKMLNRWRTGNSSRPFDYAVVGPDIWIAPGKAELELVLEDAFPLLVDDGDTNGLLTDFPQVYVHAGVSYIQTYFQDFEAAGAADALYNVAVMKVNDLNGTMAYGVAPAVRAV